MRQNQLTAAQHLLSPFSSPFFGVKFRYDCGLSESDMINLYTNCAKEYGLPSSFS
jgi:hypothetical protein